MTRKQYYPRLAKLVNAKLIKRTKGMYTLTTFGKIVYEVELGLATAISNRHDLTGFDGMSLMY